MKTNVQRQFEQLFRIYQEVVTAFDEDTWNTYGHCLTTPKKLAFHIIQSIKYYSKDSSCFTSEKNGEISNDYKIKDDTYYSRNDAINNCRIQERNVKEWIAGLDFSLNNNDYTWTGKDMESVVLFVIQHSYFHLGEMNALLNEKLEGKAEDSFARNIW
jgi:hypothetical protein